MTRQTWCRKTISGELSRWKCQETLAWKYAKESCKWVEQDEDDELFVFYSLKYIIRKVKV